MSLRRLTTVLATATLAVALTAVPAAAPAAAEAASWVRIEGAEKLPVAKKLRYRVLCRRACQVEVEARLTWPKRPNLVNRLSGRLRAAESRLNIISLNPVALNVLRTNWRASRLKVVVRARDRKTGARATARRTFRFAGP